MATAEIRREPRYGSAAELAAYAGISVKIVRRLADAGKVRRLKVGRRLILPFEDLDRHLLASQPSRSPTMPTLSTPPAAGPPRLRFDERGRAIAPTEAEVRAEAERVRRAFAEMDAIPDDPPGSDQEFFRAIDAGRPERPLFSGLY